ncbi:MAG: N-acetylmuramoyl-L-alanine amidase family protein [Planctomycetota bacterium]|jgi:N-acetylmuramoyl-L-alanine amidase
MFIKSTPKFVLFLFLAALTAGSSLSAQQRNFNTAFSYKAPASYKKQAQGIKVSDFAETYSLHINAEFSNNRIEFFNNKIRLTLIPGMDKIVYNGVKYSLSTPPHFESSTLIIPSSISALLPRAVKQKQYPEADTYFTFDRINTNITVIIDPGHGGNDPGAIGRRGLKEKDVNLNVGLYLNKFLRKANVNVVMTRKNDRFLTLQQRAKIANQTRNSIFISIHANSAKNRSAYGIETFVLSDNISNYSRSRKAAAKYNVRKSNRMLYGHGKRTALDKICREARKDSITLASRIQKETIRTSRDRNRGVRKENLHVLRESYFAPAVLVEVGFLSNYASERKLKTNSYQKKLAYGISKGIINYLKSRSAKDQTVWMRKQNIRIASR